MLPTIPLAEDAALGEGTDLFAKNKMQPLLSCWSSGNNACLPFHLSSAPQQYQHTRRTHNTNNKTKPKRVADTDRPCCPKKTAVLGARGPHNKTAAKAKDGNPVLAADPERLSIFVVSIFFTRECRLGPAPLCGLLRRQPRKKITTRLFETGQRWGGEKHR